MTGAGAAGFFSLGAFSFFLPPSAGAPAAAAPSGLGSFLALASFAGAASASPLAALGAFSFLPSAAGASPSAALAFLTLTSCLISTVGTLAASIVTGKKGVEAARAMAVATRGRCWMWSKWRETAGCERCAECGAWDCEK